MSYLVIDTDGRLHHRTQAPNSAVITAEVGEPGWDMVRIGGPHRELARAMGWVNDCGHLTGLPRNVVGTCMLASLGADVMPYAGPVVITGWHPHDEVVPLTGDQIVHMRIMHGDIGSVLGLAPGEPSTMAPPNWCLAMAQVADLARAAPTPTITVLAPGDPGWPL